MHHELAKVEISHLQQTPPTTVIMPDRRLHARRSSVTAPDPFGEHLSVAPSQGHSTITIVKVLQQQQQLQQQNEPSPHHQSPHSGGIHHPTPSRAEPSSPVLSPGFGARRTHRRHGSNNSIGSAPGDGGVVGAGGGGSAAPQLPGRLSFAFSTFAPKAPKDGNANASPPPSPGGIRRRSSLTHSSARLSPEQLYQLGKAAVMQQQQAQRPGTPTGSSSPARARAGSPYRSGSPSFRDRPASPAHSNTPSSASASSVTAPATFTPLPPHIGLPFLDRPGEVAALIATHPTCKLLSLISKTLPVEDEKSPVEIPDDPSQWTYKHLVEYMTKVDRDTDPDYVWVLCIKSCVRPHSELIWERLKGALGVTPDVEAPPRPQAPTRPYIPMSRRMSDSGYDSDVFIESPYESNSRPASIRGFPLDPVEPPENLIVPPASASPPAVGASEIVVSISPMLSPPSGASPGFNLANPPPLSLPSAISPHAHELSGLQEEEEEEEEEEGKEGEDKDKSAVKEEDDLYTPAQIQGLRIVTVPSPVSPLASYPYYSTPRTSAISSSHSFSSLGAVSPLPPYPPSSSSSAQAIDIPNPRPDAMAHDIQTGPNNGLGIVTGGSLGYAIGSNASSTSLDSMGVGPGSRSGPLFPSNFARMGKSRIAV